MVLEPAGPAQALPTRRAATEEAVTPPPSWPKPARKALESAGKQIGALQKQLDAELDRNGALRDELGQVNATLTRSRSDLAAAQAENKSLRAELSARDREPVPPAPELPQPQKKTG